MFIGGKELRIRGTAVVLKDSKLLLVRDKGKNKFSLPGGGVHINEPLMATAVRELYEELGMSARKAERIFKCDFKGSYRNHKVTLIESDDEPQLTGKELDKFIWWDMQTDIPRFPHVDQILNKLK
jgi:ADP-ribose pyrophosphatase YjhB (NUDIX family)